VRRKTIFQGILCVIAVLACLYIAQAIVLPVVLAIVLKLLLRPLSAYHFVPIVGPFCGIILFLAVGLISMGPVWAALLPAALYFAIHVLEGEIVSRCCWRTGLR
jgi:predicted PurR-regulated permease PerM